MNGQGKRAVYRALDLILLAAEIGGIVAVLLTAPFGSPNLGEYLAVGGCVVAILAGIPVLIHECGHMLFGSLAGMKLASFRFSSVFSRAKTAGATEMYPAKETHIRGRMICFTLGGAALNLMVGIPLFVPYFVLPYHPARLFCVLFSFANLYEGLRAVIPAELSAGKTDGAVLRGVIRRDAEEEIALRVLTAQGILNRKTFSEVPRALLFDAPVVREDLPAFHALLFLRMQKQLWEGEDASASFDRLRESAEYLSAAQEEELLRYGAAVAGEKFTAKKQPLHGVRELENRLANTP